MGVPKGSKIQKLKLKHGRVFVEVQAGVLKARPTAKKKAGKKAAPRRKDRAIISDKVNLNDVLGPALRKRAAGKRRK